jgi:hypothetical protein
VGVNERGCVRKRVMEKKIDEEEGEKDRGSE